MFSIIIVSTLVYDTTSKTLHANVYRDEYTPPRLRGKVSWSETEGRLVTLCNQIEVNFYTIGNHLIPQITEEF